MDLCDLALFSDRLHTGGTCRKALEIAAGERGHDRGLVRPAVLIENKTLALDIHCRMIRDTTDHLHIREDIIRSDNKTRYFPVGRREKNKQKSGIFRHQVIADLLRKI